MSMKRKGDQTEIQANSDIEAENGSHVDSSLTFRILNSDKYTLDGWQLPSGSDASNCYSSDFGSVDKYVALCASKSQYSSSTAPYSGSSDSRLSSYTDDAYNYESSLASNITTTDASSSDRMFSSSSSSIDDGPWSRNNQIVSITDIIPKPIRYGSLQYIPSSLDSANSSIFRDRSMAVKAIEKRNKDSEEGRDGNVCKPVECVNTISDIQNIMQAECHHMNSDSSTAVDCGSNETKIMRNSSKYEVVTTTITPNSSLKENFNSMHPPFRKENGCGNVSQFDVQNDSNGNETEMISLYVPSDEDEESNYIRKQQLKEYFRSHQETIEVQDDTDDSISMKTVELSFGQVHVEENAPVPHQTIASHEQQNHPASQHKTICLIDEVTESVLHMVGVCPFLPLCGMKGMIQESDNMSPESPQLSEHRTITHLYSAIHSKNSEKAMHCLWKRPEEARTWVTCYDKIFQGGDMLSVKLLPLHSACLCDFPVNFVRELIRIYPDAVRSRSGNSKYPIHIACEVGTDPALVSLLINSWPHSVYARDGENNIPLTNLIRSKPLSPRKSKIMKILLDAFAAESKGTSS